MCGPSTLVVEVFEVYDLLVRVAVEPLVVPFREQRVVGLLASKWDQRGLAHAWGSDKPDTSWFFSNVCLGGDLCERKSVFNFYSL